MKARFSFAAAALAALLPSPGLVQAASKPAAATRPPIVGVAHIAFKTKDLAAARAFYEQYLGYPEPFTLGKLTVFKVNDHQYIEVSPGLASDAEDRLLHLAFETTNARQLRDYLAGHGVKVPEALKPGEDGNLSFMTRDPDGHDIEFVQYLPGSVHGKNFGKFLPAMRVSEHIIHVGATVTDRAVADRFYKDILGFHEFWHGGRTDDSVDWIDMRVPDGRDWMEYMMIRAEPTPAQRGVMNHMALGVPSVDAGYKTLLARKLDMKQPPKIGRDGKWQLNLYDPDLTRAELMEPKPVEKPCCSVMLDQ
jgi:catechol 2,3-dioxygenase-like lactoylglutathione lyase family enzyme